MNLEQTWLEIKSLGHWLKNRYVVEAAHKADLDLIEKAREVKDCHHGHRQLFLLFERRWGWYCGECGASISGAPFWEFRICNQEQNESQTSN
jgi:hypothetical protein